MKKALDITVSVVMTLVIILAILLVGVRVFGLMPYTVLSGSMEPNYHVGSLIYVVKVDPADLEVDDAITYVIDGGTVVTHRIIEVIPDDTDPTVIRFRTKGDNNTVADGTPVHSKNIIGKPVFTIPLLGYLAYFVQNPPGNYLITGLLIALLLITFLPDLLDKLIKDPPSAENGEEVTTDESGGEISPTDGGGDAEQKPPDDSGGGEQQPDPPETPQEAD